MWKAALAGAVALAITGSPLAAQEFAALSAAPLTAQESALPAPSHAQIDQFRVALNLRPEQQQYWNQVERVLSGTTKQSAGHAGLVRRTSHRTAAPASNLVGLRELASAAIPLVQSMDDSQKLTALRYVNAMGYGALVAQF